MGSEQDQEFDPTYAIARNRSARRETKPPL